MAIQRSWWSLVLVVLLSSCDSQGSSTTNESIEISGQQLYSENCVICHGVDGKAGISGASDLSVSGLSRDSIGMFIMNGKKQMPPFSFLFSEDKKALERVIDHVESLRNK